VIEFFIACVPPTATHHHKKIARVGGFSRLVDKPELVAAREMVDNLLLRHQPETPMSGPLRLSLEFEWPWLSGHGKRLRAQGRVPKTTKPDCSNLAKMIEDRLVALRFMGQDQLVAGLVVDKFWGDRPGITIHIERYTFRFAQRPDVGHRTASTPLAHPSAPREAGLLV
jgi:Holliday junction resolvase RusA-like endonuclease